MDHDPTSSVRPRLWLREQLVQSHYGSSWPDWVVAYRDIARSTDERTMIAAVLPRVASDYTVRHLVGRWDRQPLLVAVLNSFVYDYLVRLRNNGTHLSDYLTYQMPVPPDSAWAAYATVLGETTGSWTSTRVRELSYTGCDLSSFAKLLGDDGPPFVWDDERRTLIRGELDAAFFHLYGVERDDVDYILGTFPIVRRKDEARFGEFRTKRLILEIYDSMADAEATGAAYQTVLDPPPGEGPRHPARPAT